jgi:hypothetical protein
MHAADGRANERLAADVCAEAPGCGTTFVPVSG